MSPASEASGFAANGGVRLHYFVAGAGPPPLLLHGIPDFWNGWRRHIEALHGRHRVAATDLRGFNLSDKPADLRAYRIAELVGDVIAVLRDIGAARATLVGHD
jgi:pimeloyl-ACP methyl ester carboxylesterase